MAKIMVTESLFNIVKTLMKGGASGKTCAEYVGVSEHTISIIKNSEDFEDYKRKTSVKKRKNVAQQATSETEQQGVENRQTIIVQASHYMLEEQKRTNELLAYISNKLAFIVEELTGKGDA